MALGTFLAVLVGAPAAAFLAGDVAHRHYERAALEQAATRYRTTAVLVHDAPQHLEPGSEEAEETRYPVTVRFTGSRGQQRTGETDVEPGLPAGNTVRVWVGEDGGITGPPLTGEQVRDRAVRAAAVAASAVAAVGASAYGYAGRRLRRRNLARWDAAWAETAPGWSAST